MNFVATNAERRAPDLVAASIRSPYHFRARIQSFQTFVMTFPAQPSILAILFRPVGGGLWRGKFKVRAEPPSERFPRVRPKSPSKGFLFLPRIQCDQRVAGALRPKISSCSFLPPERSCPRGLKPRRQAETSARGASADRRPAPLRRHSPMCATCPIPGCKPADGRPRAGTAFSESGQSGVLREGRQKKLLVIHNGKAAPPRGAAKARGAAQRFACRRPASLLRLRQASCSSPICTPFLPDTGDHRAAPARSPAPWFLIETD
jgi:hypothetical protein